MSHLCHRVQFPNANRSYYCKHKSTHRIIGVRETRKQVHLECTVYSICRGCLALSIELFTLMERRHLAAIHHSAVTFIQQDAIFRRTTGGHAGFRLQRRVSESEWASSD